MMGRAREGGSEVRGVKGRGGRKKEARGPNGTANERVRGVEEGKREGGERMERGMGIVRRERGMMGLVVAR